MQSDVTHIGLRAFCGIEFFRQSGHKPSCSCMQIAQRIAVIRDSFVTLEMTMNNELPLTVQLYLAFGKRRRVLFKPHC